MEIETVDDARKRKIGRDEAWDILTKYKTVAIGRGKKFKTFAPSDENREEVLKAAMGPSGNLRAPALEKEDTLIIGYNPDMLGDYL
jgi:hypothetical protein